MKISSLRFNKYVVLQCAALLLLGYSLAGCASPVTPAPKSPTPGEVGGGSMQTVRVIISFQGQPVNSRSLSAAISDACRCLPVYFSPFGNDGLIYVIALPPELDFDAFEKTLMLSAPQLGITSVEQDRMMHNQ